MRYGRRTSLRKFITTSGGPVLMCNDAVYLFDLTNRNLSISQAILAKAYGKTFPAAQ